MFQSSPSKAHPPESFLRYLCGGTGMRWPLPDSLCLFGLVMALFISARHMMAQGDPELRSSVDMDLEYAATLFGKEGSLDLLDSSPWPLSILDLYININETDFMTYEEYKVKNPTRPLAVPLESLHWQPPPGAVAQQAQGGALASVGLVVAVLGTHATLSLEPADMLGRFAWATQVRNVFYGLETKWCKILSMCEEGAAAFGRLLKEVEVDPYSMTWATMAGRIREIYRGDATLRAARLLVCTEPVAACLMLRQAAMEVSGVNLPVLGYLGVALLQGCPLQDFTPFWQGLTELMSGSSQNKAVFAVNNLILSEQIYYQSGWRMPYVRAHGLHTGAKYAPRRNSEVIFWRAPLFAYLTSRCAISRFTEDLMDYPVNFRFIEDDEHIMYSEVMQYRAVAMLPWDHALMTFYELYSAGIPLLLPADDWMYRLLYQRGQLSVGEPVYRSRRPGHTPPFVEFAEEESFKERPGHADPREGLTAAKAARGAAESLLDRIQDATDLENAKQLAEAARDLLLDMRYFLALAENRTDEDSMTSAGVVRRRAPGPLGGSPDEAVRLDEETGKAQPDGGAPWHPFTPFQMSTRDSNDWVRMRKGGWWLRRGVRFDAMRYWYQFSDFARFPGLTYFSNLPELLCFAASLNTAAVTAEMRAYGEQTLRHSAAFWSHSAAKLLSS